MMSDNIGKKFKTLPTLNITKFGNQKNQNVANKHSKSEVRDYSKVKTININRGNKYSSNILTET